jgi:phosphoribosylaminoimidazole-succinocarboxamide synthase
MPAMFESRLPELELLHRGKVRDVYAVDAKTLLIVATDRLSAFDVVLPDPIPSKGEILTQTALFWFRQTREMVPNHLLETPLASILPPGTDYDAYRLRSSVTRRLRPLPVEAVARGYLIGSGWKDYQASGEVCGVRLPAGLRLADQLPEPIFTPATKAAAGEHDENISLARVAELIGAELAARVRDLTLQIYREAARYALERGIIIADTKFEFGLDDDGSLYLIDEILTPDSSRFWPADQWQPGSSPPSFDKQFVRDYLETLDWNKEAPGPRLPAEIIERTAEKYREAYRRLTGDSTLFPA